MLLQEMSVQVPWGKLCVNIYLENHGVYHIVYITERRCENQTNFGLLLVAVISCKGFWLDIGPSQRLFYLLSG